MAAPERKTLRAKLRMNMIGKPGVAKPDFELRSPAVSAVNGCGLHIDAHERGLRAAGMSTEVIEASVTHRRGLACRGGDTRW